MILFVDIGVIIKVLIVKYFTIYYKYSLHISAWQYIIIRMSNGNGT